MTTRKIQECDLSNTLELSRCRQSSSSLALRSWEKYRSVEWIPTELLSSCWQKWSTEPLNSRTKHSKLSASTADWKNAQETPSRWNINYAPIKKKKKEAVSYVHHCPGTPYSSVNMIRFECFCYLKLLVCILEGDEIEEKWSSLSKEIRKYMNFIQSILLLFLVYLDGIKKKKENYLQICVYYMLNLHFRFWPIWEEKE